MTNLRLVAPMSKTLDRAAWHRPLVSIIVTHHNYSAHLEDALLSLLDQTHENWECVVVDDHSDPGEMMIAEGIVKKIGDPRISIWLLNDNVGQIPAFFAGLDRTKGEFVCCLDPDDRYTENFLERMVAAHHNPVTYLPIVSCDEMILAGDQVITGCYSSHKRRLLENTLGPCGVPRKVRDVTLYFPATQRGWHWSSTSGMMFRRQALRFLRPHKTLAYKRAADSYLAHGAHMLGGTLFLTAPLVYRGIHGGNAYLTDAVFAMGQDLKREDGEQRGPECIADVREAIIANGAGGELMLGPDRKRTLPQRLRRSVAKRWRKLTGGAR